MNSKKHLYEAFSDKHEDLPLFFRPWWLDAVCGEDGWNVALVEKDGQVVAVLPYAIREKFGFKALTTPQLTQCLGPWILSPPSNTKYSKRLAREKDLMGALIDQLPDYHLYNQKWHFSASNWLPFFWKGFSQTTRYTYRLNCLSKQEELWKNLQQNIRGDIRKASNREGVVVRDDIVVDEFYKINKLVFERQGKSVPYSLDFVKRIDRAVMNRQQRKIFIAQDSEGRFHAGVYIVWDDKSAYYLMGGGDPELRNSGATSLCMWEAIKFASTVTKSFDFEGSMIEPVERFFRGFGAVQTPYMQVSRRNSKLLRIAYMISSFKS